MWIRLVASHSGEAAMWRWRAAATAAATSGHAAGRGHRAVRAATASATSMVAVRAKQQEEEATASVTSLHAQSHGHRAVRDATASATSLHAAGRGHRAVRAATASATSTAAVRAVRAATASVTSTAGRAGPVGRCCHAESVRDCIFRGLFQPSSGRSARGGRGPGAAWARSVPYRSLFQRWKSFQILEATESWLSHYVVSLAMAWRVLRFLWLWLACCFYGMSFCRFSHLSVAVIDSSDAFAHNLQQRVLL